MMYENSDFSCLALNVSIHEPITVSTDYIYLFCYGRSQIVTDE